MCDLIRLRCAGETEEQFQRTVQLVQEVGFDRVNTAAYSPRPNTPAAEAAEQVWARIDSCQLPDVCSFLRLVITSVCKRMRSRILQVADFIKMDRLNRLNAVVNEVAEERAQRFAGRHLEVHTPLLIGVTNFACSLCFLASIVPCHVSTPVLRLLLTSFATHIGALRGHESKGSIRNRNCVWANRTQQAGANFLYLHLCVARFTAATLVCACVKSFV